MSSLPSIIVHSSLQPSKISHSCSCTLPDIYGINRHSLKEAQGAVDTAAAVAVTHCDTYSFDLCLSRKPSFVSVSSPSVCTSSSPSSEEREILSAQGSLFSLHVGARAGPGTMVSASPSTSPASQIPAALIRHTVRYLDFKHVLKARGVSKAWNDAVQAVRPLRFPAVYHLPAELVQQILALVSPADFNNARRTCRAWYVSSLSAPLLRNQLETIGFCKTDPGISDSKNPVYLSMRLFRECSLGADGSGKCDLRNVAVLDLSETVTASTSHFTVSMCSSHVLLCDGCVVHVYRLQPNSREFIEFATTIICPRRVIAVSMDTSSGRYSVTVLLVSGSTFP